MEAAGIAPASQISTSVCPICGYDITSGGWPEIGRVDEALRELIANWRRLTPALEDAIVEFVRSAQRRGIIRCSPIPWLGGEDGLSMVRLRIALYLKVESISPAARRPLSMAFMNGGFAPVEASPARLDQSERQTPEPGLAARGMCPAGRPLPAQIRAGVARSDFPPAWIRRCQP